MWTGLPDPGETRYLLQAEADVTAEAMGLLLLCWEKLDPNRQGLTAAEVIDRIFKRGQESPESWHPEMRAAIESLVGRGDSRALGIKLRSYRRRIFQGRYIDQAGINHRAVRWAARPAARLFATDRKRPPLTPPTPRIGLCQHHLAGSRGSRGSRFRSMANPTSARHGMTQRATDGQRDLQQGPPGEEIEMGFEK